MSTTTVGNAETTQPETQANGREPEQPTAADLTIGRIIRNLQRHEALLRAITRRQQEERDALQSRIRHLEWLRRCHAGGLDVGRLAHATHLYQIEQEAETLTRPWADLFDAESIETSIRQIAQRGLTCLCGDHGSRLLARPAYLGHQLDEHERDSVIYLLANLHRLPPLVEPPAPSVRTGSAAPEPEPRPQPQDLTGTLAAALRAILEHDVAHQPGAPIPDELKRQGWAALYTLEDPFPDGDE